MLGARRPRGRAARVRRRDRGIRAGWTRARLASLDFEDGRFAESRDGCFAALRTCPEYGRARSSSKTLEAQKKLRRGRASAGYEALRNRADAGRSGIEKFVATGRRSRRGTKSASRCPSRRGPAYLPPLIGGGAAYSSKTDVDAAVRRAAHRDAARHAHRLRLAPLGRRARLRRVPHRDRHRTSRRTIFDRYNTVLHEMITHQVHGVLPADDARVIQEHYRRAKERDDATRRLPVALRRRQRVGCTSPRARTRSRRPCATRTTRDVVRERLDRIDPALHARRTLPGAPRRERLLAGRVLERRRRPAHAGTGRAAIPLYRKALAIEPQRDRAARAPNALVLAGPRRGAESAAARAVAAHPRAARCASPQADAAWHAGRGLAAARAMLASSRAQVREATAGAWTPRSARTRCSARDGAAALMHSTPCSPTRRQSRRIAGPRGRARATRRQRQGAHGTRRSRSTTQPCACARASRPRNAYARPAARGA